MDARWRCRLAWSMAAGLAIVAAGIGQAQQSAKTGEALVPPRFMVEISGKPSFFCDLTTNPKASCANSGGLAMAHERADIRRHHGDPTRVAINAYGTRREGITWAELSNGVVVGGYHLRAREADGR